MREGEDEDATDRSDGEDELYSGLEGGRETIFGFGVPVSPKHNPGSLFMDTSDVMPKRNQVKKSRRLSGVAGLTAISR